MMTEPGLDRPIILVVDDTPDNLKLMSGLLKDRYRLKVANSGERALAIARSEPPPDLILLDIMMLGMDGYEVCRRLKQELFTRDIPVIFLTAKTDTADEEMGLQLGAVDCITKPISPPIVLARVETHLRLKATADFLRDKAAFLEQEVARRTQEIIAIQDGAILRLYRSLRRATWTPATISGELSITFAYWLSTCAVIRASPPHLPTPTSQPSSSRRHCTT